MRRRVESITEMIEGINVVSTSVSSLVSQGLSAVSIHTLCTSREMARSLGSDLAWQPFH
jgi:hypothetical protein